MKEWAEKYNLLAVINAGMYQKDGYTSVGYMRNYAHINNPHINHYQAVLAFNPVDGGLPPVHIIDRECQDFSKLRASYQTLLQGIRMISCEGSNVWKQQAEKWSTAAVGIDKDGNALFIFGETPASVHDLINALLSLPIAIHNAMYLEGGQPAALYVANEGFEIDLRGQNDLAPAAVVPNVLGIVRK